MFADDTLIFTGRQKQVEEKLDRWRYVTERHETCMTDREEGMMANMQGGFRS